MIKTVTRFRILGALFAAGLLLAACRAPSPESHAPTLDLNALYTQVAGTLVAQGQQPAAATNTPAPTQTPFVVTATPTNTPNVPVPTNTSAPTTKPPTAVPAVGCYQAYFVADVTVPDNTQMSKGNTFTKTWRIRNNGTCAWSSDFDIVYQSGTNLAGSSVYDIPKHVNPGETVEISIPMTAPNSDGTFKSSWMIKAPNGYTFGVNGHANSVGVPFFALIRVGVPSSGIRYDFAANYCSASWSSNEAGSLPCPGANSGTQGFVLVLQNPQLETRDEDEPAIWPRPNHASNGFIRGVYPEFTVQNGDRFRTQVGCLKNNPNCHLQFTFSYILNGTETVLGTWNEKLEGLAKDVNVDLSSLAGKTVRFVLTVKPNNTDYAQANGFWFVPRIIN
ncbi:MAG: hypothetical protein KF701_06815 [Anaerolineales bacterium]|nr:MAG: hypothetical protein KF701_06815 [Anaerolineales bacterium]